MTNAPLFLGLAAFVLIGPSGALALDCAHAPGRLDRVICAVPKLRQEDAALGEAFAKALRRNGGRDADLRASQTAWRETRDAACATRDRLVLERCLDAQYRFRLQVLASLPTPTAPPAPVAPPTPPPTAPVLPPAADDTLPAGSYLSDAVSFALQPDGRFEVRELGGSRLVSGRYGYAGNLLILSDGRGDVGRTVFPLQCRIVRTAVGFAVTLGQPKCRPFDGLSFRMTE